MFPTLKVGYQSLLASYALKALVAGLSKCMNRTVERMNVSKDIFASTCNFFNMIT